MPELSPKPRVALAADHAGFPIKETIRQFLQNAGYLVGDLGTWSEESVDYPDYGRAVGECVTAHKDVFGIAVCGTGIGISIASNKVYGIRAAVAHDAALLARLASTTTPMCQPSAGVSLAAVKPLKWCRLF